ncbi:hypothetical protein [Streptomyces sp. NPDC048295]|uniref:hypothetical protein n=1 Tax=Streptomyces sp. NPDC048295 TaxID=3154617 RepID=UPI00342BF7A2
MPGTVTSSGAPLLVERAAFRQSDGLKSSYRNNGGNCVTAAADPAARPQLGRHGAAFAVSVSIDEPIK